MYSRIISFFQIDDSSIYYSVDPFIQILAYPSKNWFIFGHGGCIVNPGAAFWKIQFVSCHQTKVKTNQHQVRKDNECNQNLVELWDMTEILQEYIDQPISELGINKDRKFGEFRFKFSSVSF